MQILDKTKKLFNVEKGNIKRTLLKTILAVPFWITVAALFLIVFKSFVPYIFQTGSVCSRELAEQFGDVLQTHERICRRCQNFR